jgi:hypothetical protein
MFASTYIHTRIAYDLQVLKATLKEHTCTGSEMAESGNKEPSVVEQEANAIPESAAYATSFFS